MADIRKRTGSRGTTYQVRYPSPVAKSGYVYKSFQTRREAQAFLESGSAQEQAHRPDSNVRTVAQAIDRWLDICEKEGRDGREPVTKRTHKTYRYRAEFMKAYNWTKDLHELRSPDIVAFRSWLLKNASRDQARKVLSSFHSVMREMAVRGITNGNVAAGVTIRADSRYDEPVVIPSRQDVQALLIAADELANSRNEQIAKTWERYRPMLYLAADSGMRPQEYLAMSHTNLRNAGVHVDRAIEAGGYKISVPKTRAGRRFIELSPETFDMVSHYAENHGVANKFDLAFPTATGHWQSIDNWRRRCFYRACEKAGLVKQVEIDGELVTRPKYKPYDLRHFFASMLIEERANLKRIQKLMGHEDIKTTLNTYGHLIEAAETAHEQYTGMLSRLAGSGEGESAHA